jgi:hypothetical protein
MEYSFTKEIISRITLWDSLSQCSTGMSPPLVFFGGMDPGATTNKLSELSSMPITKRDDVADLLRLAIAGLDTQIAELREKRVQLTVLINGQPAGPGVKVATPRNRRKLSAAARAKISAAQKARWVKERKGKAEKQKPNAAAKTARAKAKPIEPAPARTKAKKSTAEPIEPALARTKAKKSTAEKDKPTNNNLAEKTLALQDKEIDKPKTPKPDDNTPAGIVEQMALAGARFRITRGGSLIIGNLGSLPPTVQRMFLDHPNPHLLTAAARRYLADANPSSDQ